MKPTTKQLIIDLKKELIDITRTIAITLTLILITTLIYIIIQQMTPT